MRNVALSGQSLLRLSGWPKVEKVLHAIDGTEALGIDPADAAPDHWRHIHNRLSVGEQPRPYSRSRHQAGLCIDGTTGAFSGPAGAAAARGIPPGCRTARGSGTPGAAQAGG